MIRSLKAAFGLSLLAALTVSAISVLSASATDPGAKNHFTSDAPSGSTELHMKESGAHVTQLTGWGVTVTCSNITYTAGNVGATTQEITVTPHYTSCKAGESVAHVNMHGCHYLFTAPSAATHATSHFLCPAGKKATVQVTNSSGGVTSTMQFGAQTISKGGVVYTTDTNAEGKHTLTVDVTAEGIVGECHGLCQFLGTNRSDGKLTGSVTVEGTDANTGAPVNITAT